MSSIGPFEEATMKKLYLFGILLAILFIVTSIRLTVLVKTPGILLVIKEGPFVQVIMPIHTWMVDFHSNGVCTLNVMSYKYDHNIRAGYQYFWDERGSEYTTLERWFLWVQDSNGGEREAVHQFFERSGLCKSYAKG